MNEKNWNIKKVNIKYRGINLKADERSSVSDVFPSSANKMLPSPMEFIFFIKVLKALLGQVAC